MGKLENSTKVLSEQEKKDLNLLCDVCGEHLYVEYHVLQMHGVRGNNCKCRRAEIKEEERRYQEFQERMALDRRVAYSLIEKADREKTLENWNKDKGSEKMFKLAKKYVNDFEKMKKENVGFIFQGQPGNGKTYTSMAIANELVNLGEYIAVVSVNSLLEKIKGGYGDKEGNIEEEYIQKMAKCSLLVIDDLGTEQNTEWSTSLIYRIIDNRYRKELPLIITTNFSTDELKNRYGERTMDRIDEMCSRMYFKGETIRNKNQERKKEILSELMKG